MAPQRGKHQCYICQVEFSKPSQKNTQQDSVKNATEKVQLAIIPAFWHGTLDEAGLYTLKECEGAVIPACKLCSTAVDTFFSMEERMRYLANPETLRWTMEKIGWVE